VLQKLQTTNISIAKSNKITKSISDKLSILHNLQMQNKSIFKSNKITKTIPKKVEENETEIPVFMTLSKLDWDNNEIHAGIIKDPTAKGGLRYQVIEPVLSERDQKAFEIIKKLLITELSVSLTESESGYSEMEPSCLLRYLLTIGEAPNGLMFELKSKRSGEGFFTEYLPP